NKITRPVLSDDQLAELNIRLHEALQYAQPVEVKFYNSVVEVNEEFETSQKNLFCLGDGSGVTHSLSQASASGVEMARILNERA
ncbi:YolD-like family protein, partial [Anaerococcus vaginalis]|uniref:YolD-like family protein n=1 Tax=Anaerococcus vaginalis TaxID=33037 RepID=UPI002900D88A